MKGEENLINKLADKVVNIENDKEREIILNFLLENLSIMNKNFHPSRFSNYVYNEIRIKQINNGKRNN